MSALQDSLGQKEQSISDLQDTLNERNVRISVLTVDLETESKKVNRMKNSFIWKSTAPIRAIQKLFGQNSDDMPSLKHWIDSPKKTFFQIHRGELHVAGWCFDETTGEPADRIFIKVGNREIECRQVDRDDVAKAFSISHKNVGFDATFTTGNGTKLIRVFAEQNGIKIQLGKFLILVKGQLNTSPKQALTAVKAHMPTIKNRHLQRDSNGTYHLTQNSSQYTYIEPNKPHDWEIQVANFIRKPKFSIVVPVYNTTTELLEDMVNSTLQQWYQNWELLLVDDCSTSTETRDALNCLEHPQIKVIYSASNGGISSATNIGINKATGDFIVFLDHDDILTVDCLYELAACINREDPDFIYSDEDKLSEDGHYVDPHFKPEWSPDTMMSTMFTGHVSCARLKLLNEIGGMRSEFDGCQDWDMVLRLTETTTRISHIPKVLYHWRVLEASVASDIAAKPYVLDASVRTRQAALLRRTANGLLEPLSSPPGYHRVVYQLNKNPLISIIIPSRDNTSTLRTCIQTLTSSTEYNNYEIIIVDNGSIEHDTLDYLKELKADPRIQIVRHDAPFNYSELNNIGARHSNGELLLFLNDDTEVHQHDWLDRLGGYAQQPHVGAVGAKLLYPDGKTQHAGVLNLNDGPVHAFLRQPASHHGYYLRNQIEYNWIATTGACLMISRENFKTVGGFSEDLPVAYNDVDLCMRLHSRGKYNVVCQAVQIIHHESVSRGLDSIDKEKAARLVKDKGVLYARNPKYYQYDPFFNINLHPNGLNFEIAT